MNDCNYEAPAAQHREQAEQLMIEVPKKPVYSFFKRVFDIFAALIGLIVLFVPLLIVALIIVIDSPKASPIYVQERVGKNGKSFRFYKFRTMVPNADQLLETLMDQNEMDGPVFKIKNDPRLTRVGRFLRRTSIDELPQLWNVIKGDMSFVGPRPPLPREVAKYTAYDHQRLSVIPGLTCYWQIQPKRNSLSFDRWVELDLQYIKERNFKTDLKILFKTFGVICGGEGE